MVLAPAGGPGRPNPRGGEQVGKSHKVSFIAKMPAMVPVSFKADGKTVRFNATKDVAQRVTFRAKNGS